MPGAWLSGSGRAALDPGACGLRALGIDLGKKAFGHLDVLQLLLEHGANAAFSKVRLTQNEELALSFTLLLTAWDFSFRCGSCVWPLGYCTVADTAWDRCGLVRSGKGRDTT